MTASAKKFIAVVGPTGSGKSAFALQLAKQHGGEIINCDSVQVYRGFDIGSAKPSLAEQQAVPHHLIDIVDPNDAFDAGAYAKFARELVGDIRNRGRLPLVCGGTGLYLRALLGDQFNADLPTDPALRERLYARATPYLYRLLERWDPKRALSIHPHDKLRIVRALELRLLLRHSSTALQQDHSGWRDQCVLIYINPCKDALRQRLRTRIEAMLAAGWLEEVKRQLEAGVDVNAKPMQSIGYRSIAAVAGSASIDRQQLVEEILVATHRYAKRQRTWLRRWQPDVLIKNFGDEIDIQATLRPFSKEIRSISR